MELENELLRQENDVMVNQIVSQKTTHKNLMEEINSSEFRQLEEVKKCASNGNVKAIFLLDQVHNFDKRQLNWSDTSLQQCTEWRESSGKSYAHVRARNLLSCPSRSTLERFAKDEESGRDEENSSLEESTTEVTIEIQTVENTN